MKLRYLADLRSLAFVVTYFGLVAIQWLLPIENWALRGGLLFATCLFSFFGAVITHNTIHCPVFTSRGANRVFQVLLSLTYGSPVSSFVPGHNLSHHKHPQTARDVMRTTKVRTNSNLINMLLFVPIVGLAIMKNDRVYVAAMKGRHRAWFRQYQLEKFVSFAVTIVLFLIDWQKALIYWFLPHFYAAWGIIGMNYLQHDGCDIDHPYNHSRNFVGSFVNWWTFNNGYHGLHHRTPGLHWSLLPDVHAREFGPHVDPRLNQPSLALYLFRTFVWPGRRRMFDGREVELPPNVSDESWIPKPSETPEDLGAIPAG